VRRVILPAILAAMLTIGWDTLAESHSPWREVSYKGHTAYRVERDSIGLCLHAEANGTNSALFYPIPEGAEITSLTWRWRVLRHPAGADPSMRRLDDRAAAVFVLIHRSILPWRTQGLLYQWAPAGEPGRWTSSPYAAGIRVITLERAPAGEVWLEERRDLRADLVAAFGAAPDHLEAIGVICDGDNTGARAAAEFGEILCETSERERR
jgi:hypothetical protein